jgi:hypothetical protein
MRSGDVHCNPGPVHEFHDCDVTFWQSAGFSRSKQRFSLDVSHVCPQVFPCVSNSLLVYDRSSLIMLYHRKQPSQNVRSILYAAGLLLRRRRGIRAGCRRSRMLAGAVNALAAADGELSVTAVDDKGNFRSDALSCAGPVVSSCPLRSVIDVRKFRMHAPGILRHSLMSTDRRSTKRFQTCV